LETQYAVDKRPNTSNYGGVKDLFTHGKLRNHANQPDVKSVDSSIKDSSTTLMQNAKVTKPDIPPVGYNGKNSYVDYTTGDVATFD
jgi:hypothetical protein